MENPSRREFLRAAAGGAGALLIGRGASAQLSGSERTNVRPNILWVSCEDISPDLGCYGDAYAVSPNIDKLAAQGVRFTNAFTPAGVCAPVRSATITGMYQNSIGTCPMRCRGVPPAQVKCFPEYLRAAGYYCTNRVKTDYQFETPLSAWDECSNKAHWRGRPEGKPFFSVINLTTTHESRIRTPKGKKAQRHDPAKAKVPPYYPDTPLVRNDLACYADNITRMDEQVAEVLQQLADDALADNTIVWFWGDHGRGLPRCKRWIYDSGVRVPLVVRVPEKLRSWANPDNPNALKPGPVCEDLVSFVDFAPTMLSLTGTPVPEHLQGQAFLGPQKSRRPRTYVYAARDRIDEAPDLVRAVHDKKYNYIRNFMWHLTFALDVNYMNLMPTMQEMRRLHAEGKLKGPEKLYFRRPRPVEELYDLEADPHEIHNLASDPTYRDVLLRMRGELKRWMRQIKDVGLIPEPDFDAMKRPADEYEKTADPQIIPQHRDANRAVEVTVRCATEGASICYQIDGKGGKVGWWLYTGPLVLRPGRTLLVRANRIGFKDSAIVRYKPGDQPHDPAPPPKREHWSEQLDRTDLLERLLAFKDLDFEGEKAIPHYLSALDDERGPLRYWAVVGLHNVCTSVQDIGRAKAAVAPLLTDASWSVRIAAAHALCDWGAEQAGLAVFEGALKDAHASVRHWAMVALEQIGPKARPLLPAIKAHLKDGSAGAVAKRIVAELGT